MNGKEKGKRMDSPKSHEYQSIRLRDEPNGCANEYFGIDSKKSMVDRLIDRTIKRSAHDMQYN